MFSHEDNSSMKAWTKLTAERGHGTDWCDQQPPRKKTKQAAVVVGQQQGGSSGGLSHKVVEKRRRDRMNQALSSLSRLIPADYLKQGQSRVEKAEIIELAVQHILAITSQLRKCQTALGQNFPDTEDACCVGKFYQGFRESSKAAMSFLTDQEGFSTTDTLCCRLRAHLHTLSQQHLPNQEDLLSTRDREQIRVSGLIYSSAADEAPDPSCGSGESSCDADHRMEMAPTVAGAAAAAAATADASRRGPKSAFKQRFQAESATAVIETKDAVDEEKEDEEQLLPGFVLHESGTYYLPMVVPPSALGTEVSNAGPGGIPGVTRKAGAAGAAAGQLLHPVSIPVNFRATRFVMQKACWPLMMPHKRKQDAMALPPGRADQKGK